jgi:hypothetical protein
VGGSTTNLSCTWRLLPSRRSRICGKVGVCSAHADIYHNTLDVGVRMLLCYIRRTSDTCSHIPGKSRTCRATPDTKVALFRAPIGEGTEANDFNRNAYTLPRDTEHTARTSFTLPCRWGCSVALATRTAGTRDPRCTGVKESAAQMPHQWLRVTVFAILRYTTGSDWSLVSMLPTKDQMYSKIEHIRNMTCRSTASTSPHVVPSYHGLLETHSRSTDSCRSEPHGGPRSDTSIYSARPLSLQNFPRAGKVTFQEQIVSLYCACIPSTSQNAACSPDGLLEFPIDQVVGPRCVGLMIAMPNRASWARGLQIMLDEQYGCCCTAANTMVPTAQLSTEPPGSVGPSIVDRSSLTPFWFMERYI